MGVETTVDVFELSATEARVRVKSTVLLGTGLMLLTVSRTVMSAVGALLMVSTPVEGSMEATPPPLAVRLQV